VISKCFKCRKEIDIEHQVYYVFIGKTKTEGNAEYCNECYLQDVADANELDPSLTAIYIRNFIRKNK
jgi:hypothetical protein